MLSTWQGGMFCVFGEDKAGDDENGNNSREGKAAAERGKDWPMALLSERIYMLWKLNLSWEREKDREREKKKR